MVEDKKKVAKKPATKTTTKKPVTKKQPTKKPTVNKNKSEKIIKQEETQKELKIVKEDKEVVKIPKKANKFFNSLLPILFFSLITSIIAIFNVYYINSKDNIFIFNGFNEHVSIESGLIATNQKTNGFEGNNIKYIAKEDVMVNKYKIGYFLKNKSFSTPIITIEGSSEKAVSLKEVVNSIMGLDFAEPANVNDYFTKESIELIKDNKLFFIIEYETTKDKEAINKIIELKLNTINIGLNKQK